MRSSLTLLTLFESGLEPSRNDYVEIAKSIINDPRQISNLAQDDRKEETLLHLIAHSGRLARLFHCIRDSQGLLPDRASSSRTAPRKGLVKTHISSEIVILFLELLPTFSGILENAQVIELLISALETCLLSPSPLLWKLARSLADNGNFLEHLASDESGGDILQRWVSLPVNAIQDAITLEIWTQRLVDLVNLCTSKHGIQNEIQRWEKLVVLKKAFHSVQESMEQKSRLRTQRLAQDLPVSSANMVALDPDNKKSYIASGQERTEAHVIQLDENLHGPIREFGLRIPSTRSELEQAICTLEGEVTISILRGIACTYPCKLCKEGLSLGTSRKNFKVAATRDKSLHTVPPLEVDIFGNSIGVWKVTLSHQAIDSFQGLSRAGNIGPTNEKLYSLADGEWRSSQLAGSDKQRKRLRVPLACTKCTKRAFILWQVDVYIADDTGELLQKIIVWDISDQDEISRCIDRVVMLQRNYHEDHVRQCKQQPRFLGGKYLPSSIEAPFQDILKSSHPSTNLDVRIIDQDTIEMANKFYALTEPMMHSIIANDLNAEFPIDVSQDEIQVIRHFETSSLILGRSGTGKTTCLVFKLVGKHLARRRLTDERRIRQVLLTRSSFLADKLRDYVYRLIEGLTSEPLKRKSAQEADDPLGSSAAGLQATASALSLSDENFPLVCTFDGFLELLENTVRAMDRKNFDISKAHAASSVQEAKLATKWPEIHFVDSQSFRLDYWPRLSHVITSHISVDLVFAEIMGVIKGSTSSRKSLKPLSRQDYLKRSTRLAPNFKSDAERSRVYEAFEAYEALKIASGGEDHVDRVVKLLKEIRRNLHLQNLLASTFDEVYIDEVQDQRPLDFELLFSLVKDSRGCHFAGDTAQAISQDSTFQFADIKRLFHDHFADTGAAANQKGISQTKMFHLSKNYRSHQGILALASIVMKLLWRGFPETVDKLEPETGRLLGPKPVLFVGCDANTLISSNAGKVKISERSADFGADQVILVRDANAKTILQDQIGNVALVLTILQAKGMEFDDVLLWNFFSESPSLGGIRRLNALVKDEPDAFDKIKNWGMCSELKHLYVAITRARIQLFLFESDETAVASVIKLLTQDVPEPLVEVTRPNDANFAANVENLRPGTSNDPRRWSFKGKQLMQQGSYKDALLCFEKAQDHRGETFAKAKMHEEDGRASLAQENTEKFRHSFEEAIALFLEIDLVSDASKILVRMGDVERAAELWLQKSKYGEAAQLFEQSGWHEKAADCYHLDEKYIEAAAVLRKGNKFDRLVSYLYLNREHIPPHVHNSYSRLCKVLLKQEKISYEHRKHAVNVLGSSAEQESYFIEYEMHDDLAKFYVKHQRYGDYFDLLVKLCRLEEALSVWFEQQLSDYAAGILEDKILNVLDYVCAGKKMSGSLESWVVRLLEELDKIKMPNIACRVRQWVDICRINTQGLTVLQEAESKSLELGTFFNVQSLLNSAFIHKAEDFDSLPFELIEEAITFIKNAVLRDDSQSQRIILLLTGLWPTNDLEKPYVLLPWSPLYGTVNEVSAVDQAHIATQWVLNKLASTVILLDSMSWELFKQKYPPPCLQYLLKGFCQRKKRGEDCLQPHERIKKDYFSRNLEDLRRVTAIFCDLTVLYSRRTFMEEFQRQFLSIRRRWLERFLRQLTFVSPAQQDASVISKIQAEELQREKLSAIGPCLEHLLYHRLGKEWEQRGDFSSLLEQMQLAKTFGESVHARFFRALSYKLFHISNRRSMQEHLRLLNWLEDSYEVIDAIVYQRQLNRFLNDLERLNIDELSSMHAVTTVVENLALILILKISSPRSLVPQSWIELYVPQLRHSTSWVKPSAWEDKFKYQECLLGLIQTFARLLDRLDSALKQEFAFSLGRKSYPYSLLQQRNAECLAAGLVNLPAFHPGIGKARDHVNEVFCYSSVRAENLKHKSQDELARNLAFSLAEYEGKNSLVIISEDSRQSNTFQKGAGVTTRSMNDILTLMKRRTFSESTASKISSGLTTNENYTQGETEAICRIQKFWRSRIPKLKQHREYMRSPKAKAIEFFIRLSSRRAAPVAFKALLVTRGVTLHLKFPKLREMIAEQHNITMSCLINTEIPDQLSETLDDALQLNSQANETLKAATDHMSEEHLRVLTSEESLRDTLNFVEKAIGDIERGIERVRRLIDEISATHS